MAIKSFILTTAAEQSDQVHGFRVGSGAGYDLLQRLLLFALQHRRRTTRNSEALPALCRRPPWVTFPRFLWILATAATFVVVGMTPSDHAKLKISVSVAGLIPVTEADIQFHNVDLTTKSSSPGSNIPRPNTLWVHQVSRPRQQTVVPTGTPTRRLTT